MGTLTNTTGGSGKITYTAGGSGTAHLPIQQTWYWNEEVESLSGTVNFHPSTVGSFFKFYDANGDAHTHLDATELLWSTNGIYYDQTTCAYHAGSTTILITHGWQDEAYRTMTFEFDLELLREDHSNFFDWLEANATRIK